MAYIDQRTGKNQRAAIMGVVALLQGAAIVALINGLAVTFITRPPPERPQGEQIKLTPPPPIEPEVLPTQAPQLDDRRIIETPRPPLDLGGSRDTIVDPFPQPPLPPVPQDPIDIRPKPTASPLPIAAKPRNAPGGWATSNDYPARDLREGNQGVSSFTLTIGPDGNVQSCAITRSSGFAGLDKATCDNVSRRARFEPATDGSGNRISGSYSSSIRWRIPQD